MDQDLWTKSEKGGETTYSSEDSTLTGNGAIKTDICGNRFVETPVGQVYMVFFHAQRNPDREITHWIAIRMVKGASIRIIIWND